MNVRPGIILQARYASSRLPGKALEPIGSRSLLGHCVNRLLMSGVARIVLATTTNPEDDALAELGQRMGVLVYRGSTDDVLGRCAGAADAYALDPVIRATGDNPAVDHAAARRLLRGLQNSGGDYAFETGLPRGAALEAMTAPALHYAASVATSPYDREHVTTFIKSHPATFRVTNLPAPSELTAPSLSVTVDTDADLQRVRQLFRLSTSSEPSIGELIAINRTLAREAA